MHRAQQAAVAALLLVGASVAEAAQDGARPCCDVRVQIHGWPESPPAAKVLEAIFAETSPREHGACDDRSGRPIASIEVDWHADRTALLRVDVAQADAHYVAGRELDLTHVSNDALALTIAIAADELLRETLEHALADAPTGARAESPVASVASPLPERPSPGATREWALGSALGGEWFSSSALLFGPDAVLEAVLQRRLALSVHLGLRAPFVSGESPRTGAVGTSGARLRWQTTGGIEGGTGVSAGLDVIALATAGGDVRATPIPTVGVLGWRSLAQCCRLTAELGSGLPLVPLRTPTGGELDGLELRSSISLTVDF